MSDIVDGICSRELVNIGHQKKDKSISESLYDQYGITGIRGEIERGLPSVNFYGYPALVEALEREEFSLNDALLHTLIVIMSHAEDSNIVWRGSPDKLVQLKVLATDIVNKGSLFTPEGKVAYRVLNDYCIEHNLSPGGSADLLAVTISIYIIVNGRIKTSEV